MRQNISSTLAAFSRLRHRATDIVASAWGSSVGKKFMIIVFLAIFIGIYLSLSYRPDNVTETVVDPPRAPLLRAPSAIPTNKHVRFSIGIGWNSFGQFNNQLLTIYFAAETALQLGRRLVPQAFEIHGSEYSALLQVPFSEIFDVSNPILHQYFDLDDPAIASGDDEGVGVRNDTRFLSYVEISPNEYFYSDKVNVTLDPDNLMWYYHKMKNTWCLWYKCIEPLPVVNALALNPRLLALVDNFTHADGGAVGRSIGVHLRAGDQEHFCTTRKDYRHYIYYSCYQNTAEELIANIDLYRKNGEKIFLATNAPRDSPPVRGLYEYYGEENVLRLPHMGKNERFRGILEGNACLRRNHHECYYIKQWIPSYQAFSITVILSAAPIVLLLSGVLTQFLLKWIFLLPCLYNPSWASELTLFVAAKRTAIFWTGLLLPLYLLINIIPFSWSFAIGWSILRHVVCLFSRACKVETENIVVLTVACAVVLSAMAWALFVCIRRIRARNRKADA